MTINADCTFCHGPCFASRAVYIHPYEQAEIDLIKKIDQTKLDALRKEHGNWLIACYKCLVERCPKNADSTSVEPRTDAISIQEP